MSRPRDKRLSFEDAVESHDRVRPTYPPALFDSLFDLLPTKPEVLEVGPGTGKATHDLLARGASANAVEIGPTMASKLEVAAASIEDVLRSKEEVGREKDIRAALVLRAFLRDRPT